MDIHHNLELLKAVAMQKAKDHGCNYNIVLMNANSKGEFDAEYGSTYEFVADSYLQETATNVILLHRTDDLISEKPFCLLWDLERKEYARVESPWSDEDLKKVARFEVRGRFKTEQEVIDALKQAKKIGTIGIVGGAGNFARTIMHGDAPSPVVVADSKSDPFELPPLTFTPRQYLPEMINMDHDHYPSDKKFKKGSNFTPKKKKRKK